MSVDLKYRGGGGAAGGGDAGRKAGGRRRKRRRENRKARIEEEGRKGRGERKEEEGGVFGEKEEGDEVEEEENEEEVQLRGVLTTGDMPNVRPAGDPVGGHGTPVFTARTPRLSQVVALQHHRRSGSTLTKLKQAKQSLPTTIVTGAFALLDSDDILLFFPASV